MRTKLWLSFSLSFGLCAFGCAEKVTAVPDQSCADEHTLEVYQDREAKVIKTELDRYCLTVDAADVALAGGYGYQTQNVLVPIPDLPAQYRVEGTHILLSGKKKSCYGLTSLPTTFGAFGYKLEIDALKDIKKGN